jgi:hypothetical protein
MKTAFQVYIEQLEKNPNEILTKENVIHHAKSFLEVEKDQIVDMGNRYHDKLKTMGIITQPAVEVFSKIYEK